VAVRPDQWGPGRRAWIEGWARTFGIDAKDNVLLAVNATPVSPLDRAAEDLLRLLRAPPDGGLDAWLAVNPLPQAWLHLRVQGAQRVVADRAERACNATDSGGCKPDQSGWRALAQGFGALQSAVVGEAPLETLAVMLDCTPEAVAELLLPSGAELHRVLDAERPLILVVRTSADQRIVDLVLDVGPVFGGLWAGLLALPAIEVPAGTLLGASAAYGVGDLSALARFGRLWMTSIAVGADLVAAPLEARAGLEDLAKQVALMPEREGGFRFWATDTAERFSLAIETESAAPAPQGGFGPTALAASAGTAFAWRGGAGTEDPEPTQAVLFEGLAQLARCGWPCATGWITRLPEGLLVAQAAPGVVALRWPELAVAGPVSVVGDAENLDLARLNVRAPLAGVGQVAVRWWAAEGRLRLDADLRWTAQTTAAQP
jgi:hypothetical protein